MKYLKVLVTVSLSAYFSVLTAQNAVVTNPTATQTITQPSGTAFDVLGNSSFAGRLVIPEAGSAALSIGLGRFQSVVSTQLHIDESISGPVGIWLTNGPNSSDARALQMYVLPSPYPANPSYAGFGVLDGGVRTAGFLFAPNTPGAIINFDMRATGATTNTTAFHIGANGYLGALTANPFDIFDVSNREALGNGYMHWFASGAASTAWNAGISNPTAGVLSIDSTADGNAAGTIKAGTVIASHIQIPTGGAIAFPDGTTLSSATNAGGSSSGGSIAGTTGTIPVFTGASSIGNSGIFTDSAGRVQILQFVNGAYQGDGLMFDAPGQRIAGTVSDGGDVFVQGNPIADTSHTGGTIFLGGSGRGDDQKSKVYITGDMAPLGTPSVVGFQVNAANNVGIGLSPLTDPGAKLEVNGNVKLTAGSGASITFPDGTVQSTAWNGTTCATGGDYAESVDVVGQKQDYEPGDVITIGATNNFEKSSRPYSTMVAGVYSTKPGFVGRRQPITKSKDGEIPMAMVGIVPTKVTTESGPIHRGDLLVSSSVRGYAMKGADPSRLTGSVVGKALGALESGQGIIEVLISLQ